MAASEQNPSEGVLAELRKTKLYAQKAAPAVVDWLTESRINAARISTSGSKIIMNGEAYSFGEYVHFGIGLKVLTDEEACVLFAEESEKKYLKRL